LGNRQLRAFTTLLENVAVKFRIRFPMGGIDVDGSVQVFTPPPVQFQAEVQLAVTGVAGRVSFSLIRPL
jgi:hypothetical protein